MTSKIVLKCFLPWQDEKEEAWLRSMAKSGWQLASFNRIGAYVFKQGQPADLCYRMDASPAQGKAFDDYLQSLRAQGWQYLGSRCGWQYFSMPVADGQLPPLIDDHLGKAGKYQGMMTFMVGFLPFMLLWFPLLRRRLGSLMQNVLGAIFLLLLFLFTFATFKIYRRISQLREL